MFLLLLGLASWSFKAHAQQEDSTEQNESEEIAESDQETAAADTDSNETESNRAGAQGGSTGADEETPEDSIAAPAITPPRVIQSSEPPYPEHRLPEGLHPEVVILVHVDAEGRVAATHVEHHGDPEFDRIAEETVQQWRFTPATRDGVPVAVRVRVAVHFELPLVDANLTNASVVPTPGPIDEPPADPGAHPSAHPDTQATNTELDDFVDDEPPTFGASAEVELERLRPENRGASDIRIERDVLDAAPRNEGAEVIRAAPGVYMARRGGDAVAHSYSLRGFDAEHGQDIEFRLDGVPINQVSHLHGQGYADLGFLIGDVVSSVRAMEGISDPIQSDFAIAGSIHLDLGVAESGLRIATSVGSFGEFRLMGIYGGAVSDEDERPSGSFVAAQMRRTDGFGQRRQSLSGSVIARQLFERRGWRFSVLGIGYGARANIAGVIRRDDLNAGVVGFYDAYPDDTARNENALAARAILAFAAENRRESGAASRLQIWTSYDTFRIQANYTGYLERSGENPAWVGRGDLIEQQNQTLTLGFEGFHRTGDVGNETINGHLEFGVFGRFDSLDQTQRLLDVPAPSQPWDERVDASITAGDIALFGDLEFNLLDVLTLRAGMRAEMLLYQIDDALGNRIPSHRGENYIVGHRRSASGLFFGPRTSLEFRPTGSLSFLASYGQGFRSPQARTLVDGEDAPFTRVHSTDIGARYAIEDTLDLRLSLFGTWLTDDVAFEPQEGRLERIGPTRRLGMTFFGLVRPTSWLLASASLTYVDAELQEPPPPTADDPTPPFEAGQNLPYVPPVVFRFDTAARTT